MPRLAVAAALVASALACDSAQSWLATAQTSGESPVGWTEYRVGPTTVQFPCKPEQVAPGRTRCTLPDGADFTLVVSGTKRPEAEELRLVRAYVQALPGARLVQGEAFPVRWTERGWVDREEHLLHVAGGMECLLSARWSTAEPPPAAAEFFARARLR